MLEAYAFQLLAVNVSEAASPMTGKIANPDTPVWRAGGKIAIMWDKTGARTRPLRAAPKAKDGQGRRT
jgi:hypothetical protein